MQHHIMLLPSTALGAQGAPVVRPSRGWHQALPCPHMRRQLAATAVPKRSSQQEQPPAPEATETQRKGRRGRPALRERDLRMSAPEVIERSAPLAPYPGQFQQTLVRSFTLGGIGLHLGEYATVRVRPAFAGEGRYFVRVAEGANRARFQVDEGVAVDEENATEMELDPDYEEKKIEMFKRYLIAQEVEGYEGNFQQYLTQVDAQDMLGNVVAGRPVDEDFEYTFDDPEPIQGRGEGEVCIEANLDNAKLTQELELGQLTLILGSEDDHTVVGAELLLAALEATGVDNARIEIEGGREVPVLDGSALGWTMDIQFAGVRKAPKADGSLEPVVRSAARLISPITVHDGRGFISFVPEDTQRVSAGVDWKLDAEVLGKQWFTWCLYEDLPFRFELAPARRYLPSPEAVAQLGNMGLLRGGAESVVMVAAGDRWWDPQLMRFVHDEAARHETALLVGSLALAAQPGHAGMPLGHVVSYQANLQLHMKFLHALRNAVQPSDWVPLWAQPVKINEGEEGGEEEEEGEDEWEEGEEGQQDDVGGR